MLIRNGGESIYFFSKFCLHFAADVFLYLLNIWPRRLPSEFGPNSLFVSLPTFKAKLRSTLFPHCYNKLFDFSFSRHASIYHTRLRLGFSCLREYLFKINRCASPFGECGLDIESVKHFFLFCPRYAAQRNLLLTSAANILGETWSSSSDAKKLNFLLYGVKSANYNINCALFREVQTFIINTNRFSMATV